MRFNAGRLAEWVYPYICGILGGVSACYFIPEKYDLFQFAIVLAFFGGILLVIAQKYMIIVLCAKEKYLHEFITGMKQSGAFKTYLDYCWECEFWCVGLIISAIFLALEIELLTYLRFAAAFFTAGSLAAFFRIERLFDKIVEYSIKDENQ